MFGAPDDGVVRADPPEGDECDTLPPALVYQSGAASPIQDINRVRLKSGGTGGQLKPGFDTSSASAGRLLQKDCGDTGTSGPVSGVDETSLEDFVNNDAAHGNYNAFKAHVAGNPAGIGPDDTKAGWITAEILECPRFAILPVLNATALPPNGTTHYPIIGLKALYFWDDNSEHGFSWQGNDLKAIRAFVLDLDYLPPEVSAQVAGAIGGYLGSRPKVVWLVHDKSDPPTRRAGNERMCRIDRMWCRQSLPSRVSLMAAGSASTTLWTSAAQLCRGRAD